MFVPGVHTKRGCVRDRVGCWHTHFAVDSHGTMEFQFEVVRSERLDQPSELAEALTIDPIVRRQG